MAQQNEDRMEQYSLTLDPKTRQRLRELAQAVDRSMSSVVRILIWNVQSLKDLQPHYTARAVGELFGIDNDAELLKRAS